jgi:hypothetical protein
VFVPPLSLPSEHGRRMIAIGLLLVRILCGCFKPRRRQEAEILILRDQLSVLRQRAPRRGLQLRWVDRALFIWLYRRCPRILDAITIVRPMLRSVDAVQRCGTMDEERLP